MIKLTERLSKITCTKIWKTAHAQSVLMTEDKVAKTQVHVHTLQKQY